MTERLTKRDSDTTHENGVCCTHFNGKECQEVQGNCAYGCKWEEAVWSKLAHYEDLEEQGRLVVLPEELDATKFIQIMFKACNCLMWQDKEKCHGSEFKECWEAALKGE